MKRFAAISFSGLKACHNEFVKEDACMFLPKEALSYEDAAQIYADMISGLNECTQEYKDELVVDMKKRAIRYANRRAEWECMTPEERQNADAGRTSAHNAFIDQMNIIKRMLDKDGIDTSWREELGDDRKRIGDFACFMAYIFAVGNR